MKVASKSKAEIIIPFPSQPLAWLGELRMLSCGSEYVFPNRRSSGKPRMGKDTLNRTISKLFGRATGNRKKPLNVIEDVEYFTIHDFRRPCRNLLASAGLSSHITKRCLNHKLKCLEGIYDRHDYLSERREALQKIADLLNSTVNDLSNVVPFKRRV
jgi:integrase